MATSESGESMGCGSWQHAWMGNADEDLGTTTKLELQRKLQINRDAMVAKLAGLSEYDMRRPMTPTGTSLLGLVKHLADIEYGYLGESFDRPAPETMSWIEDDSIWDGADMWPAPNESSEYLIGLYRRACAHANRTIAELDLATEGSVAHWPPDRRRTTLGVLLIRVLDETAHHLGHADIIRELIDGSAGADHDDFGDAAKWRDYVARIQAAADTFR
jgi:hypothetical protein